MRTSSRPPCSVFPKQFHSLMTNHSKVWAYGTILIQSTMLLLLCTWVCLCDTYVGVNVLWYAPAVCPLLLLLRWFRGLKLGLQNFTACTHWAILLIQDFNFWDKWVDTVIDTPNSLGKNLMLDHYEAEKKKDLCGCWDKTNKTITKTSWICQKSRLEFYHFYFESKEEFSEVIFLSSSSDVETSTCWFAQWSYKGVKPHGF